MGSEEFYLNDKLVSVHLLYMEKYNKYYGQIRYTSVDLLVQRKSN